MDMPEVGDEVLVTLKGTVDHRIGDKHGFTILAPDGRAHNIWTARGLVQSIEVLPPTEKQWVDGDVVRSARDGVFVRAGEWWVAVGYFPHNYPSRPLTELTP